jgi:hypothetical protein
LQVVDREHDRSLRREQPKHREERDRDGSGLGRRAICLLQQQRRPQGVSPRRRQARQCFVDDAVEQIAQPSKRKLNL